MPAFTQSSYVDFALEPLTYTTHHTPYTTHTDSVTHVSGSGGPFLDESKVSQSLKDCEYKK